MIKKILSVCLFPTALLVIPVVQAWDYDGHRLVNQSALASLPADFPAFVHEPVNAERIAFLAGEPDRWRNVPDRPIRQSGGSWTDHFLDMEQIPLAGMQVATLPSFRYDFVVQFTAGRAAHADRFPPIDPTKDSDHSAEYPGFAPWAITEYFERLRSGFSYLKVFEELGTPDEIANAQANVVYQMGVMGHYVGDCAQPLHTTDQFNGWIGDNPNGYTTWTGIHSWIDGGFIAKAGIKLPDLAGKVVPAKPISLVRRADGRDPMFTAVVDYLQAQFEQVEPLYKMEKAGNFSDELEKAGKRNQDHGTADPAGIAFIEGQLLRGGEMLGSIWLTAWTQAVPDTYLRAQLLKRQMPPTPAASTGK